MFLHKELTLSKDYWLKIQQRDFQPSRPLNTPGSLKLRVMSATWIRKYLSL